MRPSLKSTLTRVKHLADRTSPSPMDLERRIRNMSDEELEVAATNATRSLAGPFERFDTAEDFIRAYSAALLAHGQQVGNTDYARQRWERARWLEHHAGHSAFRLGPRWCELPLLSCSCGGHLDVYRGLIPAEFWSRVTEDDEPRIDCYYPMYPVGTK
jgi:hypothetical protein